jgi:hypothetical protein
MMKAARRSQNTEQASEPREEFTFECFMRPLNRAGCEISPHTMPEREP